ncbi:MAG: hypothetical protein ACI976_000756 [Aureispira sp.]|jgi:hypothetical protein
MKQILFTLLLLCSFWNYGMGQIQYTGCNGAIAAGYPITLNLAGNDGTRNFYINTLPGTPCSAGTCAFRVIWTGSRWEIQLSTDGGATYPSILYVNTAASLPNPPDLSLGTWVPQGPCAGQAVTTWTGNVQNTVSSGAAEINIIGNGNSIVDGDVTPSTTDDTDFANINLGSNDVHTFTIDNTAGTAALTISSVNVSGTNAADFVRGTFPASIAAGATGNFTLTFTPSVAGVRNATVTVNNNDANETVYDYAVRGTGVAAVPTIAITEWITNPIGSDLTDEWVELHNFGATSIDIQNWEIEDEDADDDVIITSSFIIPAGGYVVIAKNKAAFEAQWLNGCPFINVLEVVGLTLANGTTGDEIIIKDASNNVVWSVAYKDDDASGIAAQYTEAPTFTTRIWGSKAVKGVDRTGNDSATGTLGYENNNTTADPNVMTSTTGDMGSPFDGTYTAPVKSIVRGDVLSFDGVDDIVIIGDVAALDGISQFTYEAWVKMNTFNAFGRLFGNSEINGFNTIGTAMSLGSTSGSLNLVTRNGANSGGTTGNVLPLNTWTHVSMVFDGTQTGDANRLKCYINGIEVPLTFSGNAIPATLISNNQPLVLGSNFVGLEFPGEMDEVAFWNTARTANEIRENMHLTLKDCPTGLVAYYQMNDGTGSATLADGSVNGHVGTLTNMNPATDWITSAVNIGNDVGGNSNSQTINTAAGVSTQNFTAANASMRFFLHSGVEDITVTYQAFTPNGIAGASGVNLIQNPMWTVNKSSNTETMVVDYTFMFAGGTFTSTDAAKYSLYHRAMNSDGNWTKVATANVVTATSATFGKISLTGQFMVVQDSENDISDVRGNMYDFTATTGRVFIPNSAAKVSAASLGLPTNGITVEAWVRPSSIVNFNDIVTFVQDNGAQEHGFELGYIGGGLSARVAGGGAGLATTAGVPITLNEWHHTAFTYDGAIIRVYLDGVEVSTLAEAGAISYLDSWLVIGGYRDDNENYHHNGAIDEVRIWSTVRTLSELRENKHLTLKGNETGLVSYYQFNNDDPVGTVDGVKDAMGVNNGMTDNLLASNYLASEVAVAGGTSDRITIGAGGVYTFPNTDIAIEFGTNTPSGEIVVSRLETQRPHGWESIGNDVDNEYFVVNNYGANAGFDPLLDITFSRLNYVSPTDVGVPQASSPLQIYKRADNAFGATWGTSFGGADNATSGTNAMVSFNNINNINSFSQIVLGNNLNNSDLPVELMKFDAVRLNADKVQLDWITATELNNEGFYIERMLETENEFSTVAYVEGQGNSTAIVNYKLLDENAYTSVSYYRLRQVDFDGTTTYSQIRAVEGRDNKLEYMDVSIYPNPVQNELKIRFNELPKDVKSAQVSIMSIDGKVLYEFTAGVQSYQLLEVEEVAQLSGGLYLLSIYFDNTERVVQKFIKK